MNNVLNLMKMAVVLYLSIKGKIPPGSEMFTVGVGVRCGGNPLFQNLCSTRNKTGLQRTSGLSFWGMGLSARSFGAKAGDRQTDRHIELRMLKGPGLILLVLLILILLFIYQPQILIRN